MDDNWDSCSPVVVRFFVPCGWRAYPHNTGHSSDYIDIQSAIRKKKHDMSIANQRRLTRIIHLSQTRILRVSELHLVAVAGSFNTA